MEKLNEHILQSVKMKLMPSILIIVGTSKQDKRMPRKVLNESLKGLGRFYSVLVCVLCIRDFDKIFGRSLL